MSRTLTTKSVKAYVFPVALSFLQSPETLISLNPVAVSSQLIHSTPSTLTYSVTDSLTLLGFIRTTTSFTVTFTNCERGVDTEARASMGVIARSQWRVDDDGRIVERGELYAPSWLMAFVYNKWKGSHQLLMDRVEEKLSLNDAPEEEQEAKLNASKPDVSGASSIY